MPLEVVLTTGRTVAQGVGIEAGKWTREYFESAAVIEVDPTDMEKLGVRRGDVVRVKTQYGEAVLKAVKSANAPHEGIAFVPLGPWANLLINPETDTQGMPSFKNVPAVLERAPADKIPGIDDLIKKYLK